MQIETCTLDVKVLVHWTIQRFSGEVIVAAVQPRFVVALQIVNSQAPFAVEGSGVTLTAHKIVFFAIDSLTRVFEETDILGKTYRMVVEQSQINGKNAYTLRVAS